MTLNNSKFIDLGFATVKMRDDGIVNTNVLFKKSATLEQAKKLLEAYIQITKGIKTPHLFTMTKLTIMEAEVMEFMANVANNHGKADAFVIHSLPQKILGNIYLNFKSPQIPTCFFSSEEKAIEWLSLYKDKTPKNIRSIFNLFFLKCKNISITSIILDKLCY
jgi:hypothetical protein